MMKCGTMFKQREIILVPFPYSDLSKNKRRPAMIISNNNHNLHNEDVICCAITSNPREYEKSLPIEENDFENGKLIRPSRIKPTKILSLDQRNIIKVLGKLNVPKSKEVIHQLNCSIKIEE